MMIKENLAKVEQEVGVVDVVKTLRNNAQRRKKIQIRTQKRKRKRITKMQGHQVQVGVAAERRRIER